MPQTILNTPGQANTVSNDGRNVRPELMPVSHFFIQSNDELTYTQSAANKFGATSDIEFRTTSKITFTGLRKVYAVCKGQVLLQPNPDPDKINLILKPFIQPINELPIKYFVYRGLKKSDFVAAGTDPLIAGSEETGPDFVRYIWAEFNKFYSYLNSPDPTPFLAKYIGYPAGATQDLNMYIDELFYKIAVTEIDEVTGEVQEPEETAFELPIIPRGIYLGTAEGEVGFDIVLNDGDYYIPNDPSPFKLNLSYARSADHVLSTVNGVTDYEKKLIREACTKFIDPAAFYGMHANGKGKLYLNDSTEALVATEDIYSIIGGFNTKNSQYIYIQSNRQRSYNFYGNYGYPDVTNINNLIFSLDGAAPAPTVFGNYGWPLHVINNATSVGLQLITDNHKEAALYVKIGSLSSEHENNFVRNSNLLQPIPEEENTTVDLNYTKTIVFSFQQSGTDAISGFTQLIYEGKQLIVEEYAAPPTDPNAPPAAPVFHTLKDIDDIFGLLDAVSFIKAKSNSEYSTIVENNLQIFNYINVQGDKDPGIIKNRCINDIIAISENEFLTRLTFETLLVDMVSVTNQYFQTVNSNFEDKSSKVTPFSEKINNFYKPEDPYFLKSLVFTYEKSTITALTLGSDSESFPAKTLLGITNEEKMILQDLISQESLNLSKIYFLNLLNNEEDFFTSLENIKFKIYSLAILAEVNGQLNLFIPSNEIHVYTIDSRIFASSNYSELLSEISEPILIEPKKIVN